MTDILVAISTVADGSMYNRHDKADASVIHNREVFLKKHHISLEQTTRVRTLYEGDNYCRYKEATEAEKGDGMKDDQVAISDGLVTTNLNHALFLPVADCVGAVLYDPKKQVLMVSHLGRHSLEQGGGIKSVAYLKEKYGCDPKDLKVWLTPAPGKDAYPIWKLDNKGMKEVTFEQLSIAGILPENITDNPADSTKDVNYYSYSEFLKGNRKKDGDHVVVAMMR
ncbi:MAG: laccase domain-containing protein [Candidatus Microsaccharimonas sp.]|jgi:copper oxidase (laccase) domain-containing protein